MKKTTAVLSFGLLALAALTLHPDIDIEASAPNVTGRSAPELEVSEQWINSEPLHLHDLRGKVILIDFWTYSCINCLRTIPYLNKWYERYSERGLVIIGIHAPEFEFEGAFTNVQDGVKRLGIHFPVAQDNDYITWKRYDNVAWPAFYLIDREGKIAFTRYGEGEYGRMENRIRQLLGIDGSVPPDDGVDLSQIQTEEIYLGSAHVDHQGAQPALESKSFSHVAENMPVGATTAERARPVTYGLPDDVRLGEFVFEGPWVRAPERATLVGDHGSIVLRFNAAKVHFVVGAAAPTELLIRVDDGPSKRISVERPQLHTLYDSEEYKEHTIRIEISNQGLDAYSFTFG